MRNILVFQGRKSLSPMRDVTAAREAILPFI
jgi:hypothetical protein